MNYGAIKDFDIANGPGVRVTLFVSGCRNHCKNCFQPETWDFAYGRVFDEAAKEQIFNQLSLPYIRGLTLLGGEPFEPENQRTLVPFLQQVRETFPKKDIWCYSGYRLEEIAGLALDGERIDDGDPREARTAHVHTEVSLEMLSLLDVLVDGRFVDRLRNLSLEFRGSSNQRLIDLKKTLEKPLEKGLSIVLWENTTSKRPKITR